MSLTFRVLARKLATCAIDSVPAGSTVKLLADRQGRLAWSKIVESKPGVDFIIEWRSADQLTWSEMWNAFPITDADGIVITCSSDSIVSEVWELPAITSGDHPIVNFPISMPSGSRTQGWELSGDDVALAIESWNPSPVRPILPTQNSCVISSHLLSPLSLSCEEDLWDLIKEVGFVRETTIVISAEQSSDETMWPNRERPAWWDGSRIDLGGTGRATFKIGTALGLTVASIITDPNQPERLMDSWTRSFDDTVIEGQNMSRVRDWDKVVRNIRAHYVVLSDDCLSLTACKNAIRQIAARRELDAVKVSDSTIIIKPQMFRWLDPPSSGGMRTWWDSISVSGALCGVASKDGSSIKAVAGEAERPLCWDCSMVPKRSGFKVAILSMCGVTSFEDRYGLGGEHQVVHWLREEALEEPGVMLCDVFDQSNVSTAEDGFYDIVLSNSAWCKPPKTALGGTTIFWHFNTNSWTNEDPTSVAALGYDLIWTNSRSQLPKLEAILPGRVSLVDLNSSWKHHFPVERKVPCLSHDVCYVGGYQVHYKGKDKIESFIAPALEARWDFAIYGNRKWQSAVQREAIKSDAHFKAEHYDERWDPVYRGILHPDDFRHLARSCKIWLNFNAADQAPLGMINDRPIWALACGAFMITDDTPEQRELFGEAVDYTTGGSDLRSKIDYWLSHEEERLQKASIGPGLIRDQLGLTTKHTIARMLRAHESRSRTCSSG